MNLESKGFIHNEFDIEVTDSRTGRVKQTAKAYNIVLDYMFIKLLSKEIYFNYIAFGDGIGAQDKTRTSLFNCIGIKSAVKVETIRKDFSLASYTKRKIAILPSEFIGKVFTEVGIGSTSSSTSGLVTHAIIKDSEGNPISITKLGTDLITIYATVYARVSGYGTNVGMVNSPNKNALLELLLSESSFTTPKLYVGTDSSSINEQNDSHVNLPIGVYRTPGLTADVANKTFVSNVARFETTESNGRIYEVGIEGVARILLKDSALWPGKEYLKIGLGQGDGISKHFSLTQGSELKSSIKVYNNGTLVSPSEYKIMSSPYAIDGWIPSLYKPYIHNPVDRFFTEDGRVLITFDRYVSSIGPSIVPTIIEKTKLLCPANRFIKSISDDTGYLVGNDIRYNKDKTLISINAYVYGKPGRLIVWNMNTDYSSNDWGPTTKLALPTSLNEGLVVNACPWSKDDKFVVIPLGTNAPYMKVYNFDSINKAFGAEVIGQIPFSSGVSSINFSKDGSRIIITKTVSPYIEIRPFDSVTGLIGANIAQLIDVPVTSPKIILSKTETLIGFEFRGIYGPMICSVDLISGSIGKCFTIDGGARDIVSFDFSFDEEYLIAGEKGNRGYIYLIDKEDNALMYSKEVNLSPSQLAVVENPPLTYVAHHPTEHSFIVDYEFSYSIPNLALNLGIVEGMRRTVKFKTPPKTGEILTVDYSIDYIPKSENYVLDVSYTISFAEDTPQ